MSLSQPLRSWIFCLLLVGGSVLAVACSDEGGASDDAEGAADSVNAGTDDVATLGGDNVVVVNRGAGDPEGLSSDDVDACRGDDCDASRARADACGDEDLADVIIRGGEVIGVVCYPRGDEVDVREVDGDGNVILQEDEGDTLIELGSSSEQDPIQGDLNLDVDSEVGVIGQGPEETVVQGNLNAHQGDVTVRGVTLTGDASFNNNANYSGMAYCRVYGNLNVHVERFTALDCRVFGDVSINSDHATLVDVGVGGNWNIHGGGHTCEGCYSFEDDGDRLIDDDEVTGALSCGG